MRLAMLILLVLAAFACRPADAADLEMHKDLAYRSDNEADESRHKLDVYMPKASKNTPVLFLVHGGAWKFGDKWTMAEVAKGFVAQGIGVVAPNYRFSPKVKHPAHIEDVARAFAWTHDNIAKYGGDPKKIVLAGHSAGGHLVSLLGTNETYLKAEKKSLTDIRGVIGVSGVYQIDHRVKMFHDIFGKTEEVCKSASPFEQVGKQTPPMLLIYADKDLPFLDTQAEQFARILQSSKLDATIAKIAKRDHITLMYKATATDDPVLAAMSKFILERTR